MKKLNTLIIFYFCFITFSFSQMWNGIDSLYGNEWINYDNPHYKIDISNDGIYRIPAQNLQNSGIPISSIQGSHFQLFHNGIEIPIYTSSNGNFDISNDYIEFYGEMNRGNLDKHLFVDSETEQANPEYSMFTDTSAYFLTWNSSTTNKRFDNTSNNLNSAPSNPSPYCLSTITKVFGDEWNKKKHSAGTFHSAFQIGEGFVSPIVQSQTVVLEPSAIYTGGPESMLNLRYTSGKNPGNNIIVHKQTIKINDTPLSTDNFSDVEVFSKKFTIATSSITSPSEVSFEGEDGPKDKQGVAFVKLTYPRTFDFEGLQNFKFKMPISNAIQYLEIQNFDATSAPILYDLTNNRRIITELSGGLVKIALPPLNEESEFILVNNTSFTSVSELSQMSFVDYSQLDADYIIISNKKLFNDSQSGTNWIQEYANYRNSSEGGNFTSLVVDIEDLYHQFSYGINRHPLSIRNFSHYIEKTWSNPKYIFLIGKGREYHEIRSKENIDEALATSGFLVPTFGAKGGADNLLLASNTSRVPIFAIGRIAVSSSSEVEAYLNKVIVQEENQALSQSIENRLWMKNIIHLGGGNAQEQPRFRGYLNNFKSVIENNRFGANVNSFFKNTSDPIQIAESDRIQSLIDNGVSMITFFGHSSSGGFDYSIDIAESYNNTGKYPIMFSFGCYSGAIHAEARGVSENFILTSERGAIAFFASTGLGFEGSLERYGQEFYNKLGSNLYGESIGNISKATIKDLETTIGFLAGQMTLHGDPALKISTNPGPDYTFDPKSLDFSSSPININQDSFNIAFDILNLGENINQSMILDVKQELPNGTFIDHIKDTIPTPAFKSSFNYKLANIGREALGLNNFQLIVDSENMVNELPNAAAENNNILDKSINNSNTSVYFISNEVIPVYPKEFSIVSAPNLELKASTSTSILAEQGYIIEIDTTENFNSPFLMRTELTQKGGVLKWTPNIPYQNNTVYYWRVSPEENSTVGLVWKTSSFLYLVNTDDGWNQSHFYQYKKDRLVNMQLPETDKVLSYIDNFKNVQIRNFIPPTDFSTKPAYFINSDRYEAYFGQPSAGVFVSVIDTLEIETWTNPPGGIHGSFNPYNRTFWAFPFKTNNTTEREKLINFLENIVPSNYYVVLFTVQKQGQSYLPEEWASDSSTLGTNIFDVLENQGANLIRNTETSGALPYIFMYQKNVGALKELLAIDEDELLETTQPIMGTWDRGYILSTEIGPAKKWTSVKWNDISIGDPNGDESSIDIYGIDSEGNDSLLFENVTAETTDISNINVEEFPYLQLRYNSKDSINRTAPQLEYWRVLFDKLPEAALNPNKHFSFYDNTIQQGDYLDLEVAIENIGNINMDSLLVNYTITDASNTQKLFTTRLAPLLRNDTLLAKLNIETTDLSGKNSLVVEVNPDKDQPEEFHFNNIGFLEFSIEEDKRNPILDVTFDGVHIMDNDLVSSKPSIIITLKDENEYLILNDTSLVKLFLQSPGEEDVRQIFIDGDTLTFFPASSSQNKATLEFRPYLIQDGKYTLIVQAQDKTGNNSGDLDYKVSFEVRNKSSISNVLNYPNPFSTSTRFVFTITGSEIPDRMKIQIMTVSGKIVREITSSELGPIHVGNNITEFAWDGTDDFGDKLANGVYLYKVITQKANGETFEPFQTKADSFMKNGFGKMVILR